MPIRDRPSYAQMESLVALLCYNDEQGKIVAGILDINLLEGDYREIATRVLEYRTKHNSAPKLHTSDLLADILEDADNPRKAESYRRILYSMASLAEGGMNTEYILSDLQKFTRWQSLRASVLEVADYLQKPMSEENIEAVERAMSDVIKARYLQFDAGMRLDDELEPFLTYLEKHRAEFTLGIPELDRRGIVPARGEVMLFIAGKGRGKSWLMTHIGKRSLRAGKRVSHITLENSDLETKSRYYMSLFAIPSHEADRIEIPRLRVNREGVVTGYHFDNIEPAFDYASPDLRAELESNIERFGSRINNLIIKRFPNRTLTIEMLEAYLDRLEQIDGFIPDILLLDYPKLMKMRSNNASDWRLDLRDNTERLRALAVERNIALVIADQLTRKGHETGQARSTHIGEDWSQVHTADIVITHSATEAEIQCGLCRLFIDHARGEKDKFSVLLTQSFEIGQFVLSSAMMPSNYIKDIMPRSGAPDEDEAEEEVKEQEKEQSLIADTTDEND